ncbi:sigma-54 dependent transcriptional regulator [soil metagenome]
MKGRILIVDDDAAIRETLTDHLSGEGYTVLAADSAEQALNRMSDFDPALVVTDVRMPGMTGIELASHVRERSPDTYTVVITAFEDMDTAVGAMRAGAFDLLVKPLDLRLVEMTIERCFRDRALHRRMRHYAGEAAEPYALGKLVGRDPKMIDVYKVIGSVASTRTPVLIRGETGTGKEVVARAIHFNSLAAQEPFVAINCTALSETLLESELFGHVRGAFTGAVHERRGRFELAGGGTVFLDEIGDTSPAFQAKLLRVLQEHEFEPVGGERARRTEARVIAATHRPLEALVKAGSFREDLYFRLRVVELRVPPLRERRGDVPLLARHLLARIAGELHRELYLSESVLESLSAYPWPGNVRELENALARAAVLARGKAILPEHLALGDLTGPGEGDHGGAGTGPGGAGHHPSRDASLADVERAHVVRVLTRTRGNKREACRILRISRPRLDRTLSRHGIEVTEYAPPGIDA